MEDMSVTMLVMLVLAATAGGRMAEGAVYKVGDSQGWTILGSPNYTAWAVSKYLQEGDTIVFEYNKNFHNVLEVGKADYSACNAASPIATYTSGNDSITIKTKGHHFFICGFIGHCSSGPKVDIRISEASSSAAPSTSSTASLSPAASPSSVSANGSISTSTASPPANSGTKSPPKGIALTLAAFSLNIISMCLVSHRKL